MKDRESDIKSIKKTLSTAEKKVLKIFLDQEDMTLSPDEIFSSQEFKSKVEVMNAISWLKSKNLVNMKEIVRKFFKADKEGVEFIEDGLPERKALDELVEEGRMEISELASITGKKTSIAIGWMKRKDWVEIKKENGKTILTPTKKGEKASLQTAKPSTIRVSDSNNPPDPEISVLKKIKKNGISEDNLDEKELMILKSLASRKNVVKTNEKVIREITITKKGKKVIKSGIEILPEVTSITSDFIKSGKWKNVDIRPYDIHAFAPKLRRGTVHPLTIIMENIREIFVSMGFREIYGEYVESSFWNMDALFIPQDHPARELQDTFYLKNPAEIPLEDDELVEKIRMIHENGGDTGSTGWEYNWHRNEAERAVLRTHTTVNTIRYLSENPKPPQKVFSLGRVFRKEAIDSTHLPEFHQIEGILLEKNASFGILIGLLKEFYSRMGFQEIRFRPGYFPYTEPSMEVEVKFNGEWLELGGSGIFRQEVTSPFGIKYPVLAWGLGLERLAMLRLGLNDIRELYIPDISWLQEAEGKL